MTTECKAHPRLDPGTWRGLERDQNGSIDGVVLRLMQSVNKGTVVM